MEANLQTKVAFQGINGANSEMAILQHFGENVEPYPCASFEELFEAVQTEQVQHGLLPVENAFAGSVSGAYELLMEHDFHIQAEVIYHVHHALLALPDEELSNLKYIRSHPQALAQSARFLKRYNLTPVRWYDTAGAAKDLDKLHDKGVGVLASTLAAKLYGLDILMEEVEDVQFNLTRFFLLGKVEAEAGEKNKTSIVFATRHHPSALYDCLSVFADHDINLTKLESRPRQNRPWEPIFFLDFEGHWRDPECQNALTRLLQKSSFVKMLGSYPVANSDSVGL